MFSLLRREWVSELLQYEEIPYLWKMNHDLTVPLDDDTLRARVHANRTLLEKLAVAMIRRGASLAAGVDVDPYEFQVDALAPPEEWGAAPGSVKTELAGILAAIGEPGFVGPQVAPAGVS